MNNFNHHLVMDKNNTKELLNYILHIKTSHLNDLRSISSNLKGESAIKLVQAIEFYERGNEALAKTLDLVDDNKD